MKFRHIGVRWTVAFVVLVAVSIVAAVSASAKTDTADTRKAPAKKFILGVSNTFFGNGWRDEMICSIKAQALASGVVSKVIVANRNTDTAGQIADMRKLMSAGANAIVINPSDVKKLNPLIALAHARGVQVVSVDQRVTSPYAHNVTNDQFAYGKIGATWLFTKLKGKGNVVEMRGIAGVPADTDRHAGFQAALRNFPNIKVVKSVFMGWDFAKAGQQMTDILNSGVKVDGVWNSGADYTVITAFEQANKPLVPIVGADNNEFLHQMLIKYPKLRAAAVTNPATIGGAGAAVAIKLLKGQKVRSWVKLTPLLWQMPTNKTIIKAYYSPKRPPTYSARLQIKPWTTYTIPQLTACKGP